VSELVFVLLLVPAALIALVDWRKGVFLAVAVGFLQDPVRKIAEGQPVTYVLGISVIAAVVVLGMLVRGVKPTLAPVYHWHERLRVPVTLFFLLVLLQLVVAFVQTGSIAFVGTGAIAYLSPLMMLFVGFWFALHEGSVVNLIKFYIAGVAIMISGVYLAVLGYQSPLLESVGAGLIIYPETGGSVFLPSGFFRVPETAAWHGGAALALLSVLLVSGRWRWGLFVASLIGLFILGATILTGRRKIFIELLMFFFLYGAWVMYLRRGARNLALFLALCAAVAFIIDVIVLTPSTEDIYRPYVGRYSTVLEDAWERVTDMTVGSFKAVVAANGFLGSGAGVASQGAQYYGGGAGYVGGASEGGLAKLLAELGVPGLLLFLWCVVAIGRSIWISVDRAAGIGTSRAIAVGGGAFLISNLLVYAGASQVYGDPFVLFMIGLLLGQALSVPAAEYRTRHLNLPGTPQHRRVSPA